ncbi:phage tail tube protein [Azorhizophilus paspali]|uniref:Phage tail tube protein n=1 Tax=Azorhizophilus paspali TaxID=69963 RepID=A0ABV6SI73_AZOPA
MSGVNTSAGIRFYIGPAYSSPIQETSAGLTAALAALEALTYVEVGEVEDAGEIGDTVGTTTFTALSNRRARKYKTIFDAGEQQLVIGLDGADAGQAALKAAQKVKSDYAFKVDYGDGSVDYYVGQVTSVRKALGTAESIRKLNVGIAINSAIVEDNGA